MELTNEVYSSVNKYFSVLSHTGYKSYAEVDELLIFTFIEELLYGPLSQYITEQDYNIITDSLDCLYGSCMIPFPAYKKSITGITKKLPNRYRVTESGVLRSIDTQNLRVKS